MLRSSGAVSTLGSKLPVLIAEKPPSTPGTAVSGCGVLTVDIPSPPPTTHPSKDERSRQERLSSPSCSMQIRCSASTKLLSSSKRFTILSIRQSARWKPLLSAASTSFGYNSKKMVTSLLRSTKLVRSVLASRGRRRLGRVFPAAAKVIEADHAGKAHQAIR